MFFGFTSFSEVPIADDGFVRTDPYGGGPVIIYFNKDVLTFPLQINRQSNFECKLNKQSEFNLDINKTLEFSVRR